MVLRSSILIGKLTKFALNAVGMGATALPGKVALKIDPDLLSVLDARCEKKVIVTGTNGKTTTNNLIYHILTGKYGSVLSNLKGANMPQGVASAFINNTKKKYDWGVFEVDEGSFKEVVNYIKPDYVIITNFFRDQLDRYGEIEHTSQIVYDALKPLDSTLILNADDPSVVKFKELGKKNVYYGVSENDFSDKYQMVIETRFCPLCMDRLEYEYFNYGQLGKYYCKNCGLENPTYDYRISSIKYRNDEYYFDVVAADKKIENLRFGYEGIYNAYNCCAALAFCLEIGMDVEMVTERIENFEYHLGRMENFEFPDKTVKLVLSKNPIGLTEVIKVIFSDERKKSVLFILNDNPADGKDISWIWDADMGRLKDIKNLDSVYCSGIRAEDIALRIKYADVPSKIVKTIKRVKREDGIETAISQVLTEKVDVVYVLPTYTAVFKARDILLKHLKSSESSLKD
ncbi:Mur ligase family protein [Methanobacterium paludis]|uniref:Lipid II isoglutaminyl synthase (glutamine-hydrolyzing) subunit MurT n=1 Tax=Methanobacterium paludis (strain DSM 25820 / JCM 18151 / SWAN1) TaxID=868131 RepID=F6D3Q8_METPW|nr:Mur ligase family protein [Methanobacterium paludis]AEG18052.1 domain of unknown function DUF1727 [Methanobacterium paludis]